MNMKNEYEEILNLSCDSLHIISQLLGDSFILARDIQMFLLQHTILEKMFGLLKGVVLCSTLDELL